jgi:hypothetical protein
MLKPPSRRSARLMCVLYSSIAILAAGCSSQRQIKPVDSAKARETLRAALDKWKTGARFDELQSASPPIYVVDLEWKSGALLKDYRLVNDGNEMDAQLYCPVELTIELDGKDVVREVTYMITTAPKLVVSRKVF